jgi:hypothetical protein
MRVAVTHVFLSYSSKDRDVADRLSQDLATAGVRVWSDRALLPGADWQSEISRALEEAAAVIVIISPASLESRFVQNEWSIALGSSKRVIPVLAGGASFLDLPSPLDEVHGVDLNADYRSAVAEIIAAVEDLERSDAPPASDAVDMDAIVENVLGQVMERLGVDKVSPDTAADVIDEALVFVVTSYERDMEPIFAAIKSAAEKVGLRAERVKDRPGDYRITDKMLAGIREARLIVADLTHERPNVYFELGYARGLGKTVVTILREGTEAHFDVRDWTYIEYVDSRPLEDDLVERFEYELTPRTR